MNADYQQERLEAARYRWSDFIPPFVGVALRQERVEKANPPHYTERPDWFYVVYHVVVGASTLTALVVGIESSLNNF